MPENERANTMIDGLNKNPFTTRIQLREVPDPEDVVRKYKDMWGQPDWSVDMILESLVNSNRSTIVSLQGYLRLIRDSLTQEAEPVYKAIENNVQYIADVHELVIRYLHR
jgi:hypothetical protein